MRMPMSIGFASGFGGAAKVVVKMPQHNHTLDVPMFIGFATGFGVGQNLGQPGATVSASTCFLFIGNS
jgi:hypothetical protein